jgi:hypothetical protein
VSDIKVFVELYDKLPEGNPAGFLDVKPEFVAEFAPVPEKIFFCQDIMNKSLLFSMTMLTPDYSF